MKSPLNPTFLGLGTCDALDHFRRNKEPPAVVFPVINVICEVVIHAGGHGIDIENLRRLAPAGATLDSLWRIANGNHLTPVCRSEWQ
jgi:hypothetical protein